MLRPMPRLRYLQFEFLQRPERPPRRCERFVQRRQRAVRQRLGQPASLDGHRNPGERRGNQLRLVLTQAEQQRDLGLKGSGVSRPAVSLAGARRSLFERRPRARFVRAVVSSRGIFSHAEEFLDDSTLSDRRRNSATPWPGGLPGLWDFRSVLRPRCFSSARWDRAFAIRSASIPCSTSGWAASHQA